VRDELVHLEIAIHVVCHEAGQLRASLDTSKRTSLPHAPGDELERTCGDFLPGGRNADDDALAPALVARLERGAHNVDVACAVKRVVAAAVCHLDQLVLDALGAELGGVDKVCGTELLGPGFLGVVDVHHNDLAGLVLRRALDDGQPDATCAEHSNVGSLLHAAFAGGDDGGAVARGDAAAKQACAVHGRLFRDGDDGDVGDDGVLREGGGAHEVQQVFTLALEARGAVGHDALSLCGADLAAEVGLAGLAELAFLAFGCA
jgi:hypothetical protein